MKLIKYGLISFFFAATFAYGIGVGLYQWFPFDLARSIKKTAKVIAGIKPPDYTDSVELEIKIKSTDELKELRTLLTKRIFPENDLKITTTPQNSDTQVSTEYYGGKINAIFRPSPNSAACLRIYMQGHGGNPLNFEYHNQLRDTFTNVGCDTLSFSMLGLGLNDKTFAFPTRQGTMTWKKNQKLHHGIYSFFYDERYPDLDPLSLFLFPHAQIIKHVLQTKNYQDVALMGISGGGWSTVWLSALLPEIKTSISYAGSLPFAYRPFIDPGDWEQDFSSLYKTVSYLDLYQLMRLDQGASQTRNAFLVYNNEDPCCWRDPYASHFQKAINASPHFPIVIVDKSDNHSMRPDLVHSLLTR